MENPEQINNETSNNIVIINPNDFENKLQIDLSHQVCLIFYFKTMSLF
jgi:hypothetical protein